MRFLVTGLPRSRTAWLAAVLTAHGFPTLHDPVIVYGRYPTLEEMTDDGWQGLSDPSAPMVLGARLYEHFRGKPVVVVRRDPEDSRKALERYTGTQIPDYAPAVSALAEVEARMSHKVVEFGDLDQMSVVASAVLHLTGRHIDDLVLRLFDTLKIEQHIGKAHDRIGHLLTST